MLNRIVTAGALALVATPAIAAPVEVTARAMTEQRQAASDGTTRIALVPVGRITPGDRVVYQLAYRNAGALPARDVVIANPVPRDLVYAGPADGSAAPEVSVDGITFGLLSQLRTRGADGASRPAALADVRVVRWRIGNPVAPGGHGQLAFRAILK